MKERNTNSKVRHNTLNIVKIYHVNLQLAVADGEGRTSRRWIYQTHRQWLVTRLWPLQFTLHCQRLWSVPHKSFLARRKIHQRCFNVTLATFRLECKQCHMTTGSTHQQFPGRRTVCQLLNCNSFLVIWRTWTADLPKNVYLLVQCTTINKAHEQYTATTFNHFTAA